jgi:lipopolysaccharide export system permease protein
MKNFVINKYLAVEFLKSFLNVLLLFCCVGLLMNLFEEINYFRKYDIGMGLPMQLSLMIIPSIVINMLPFILFLSSMWVLVKLKNNKDLLSLRTFGISNGKFIFLFSSIAFIIGIIILTALNPVTSVAVKYYEDIKGSYDLDKSHLASINANGIWIKEKIKKNTNIIRSEALKDNFLIGVSIYKFDENNLLVERIEAKQANIRDTTWLIEDGYTIQFQDKNITNDFENLIFYSTFNREKLNSIYSNLDTISFYKLITESKELVARGYNAKLLKEKKHFYLSLPFFLVLMVLLSGIFTLNSNERKQNVYYVFLSIITCVIIFYFKSFSTALGATEKIPLLLSVWSPIIILFLFCSASMIQFNEK